MIYRNLKYKDGYDERYREYELSDIINCDDIPLFDNDRSYWKGFRLNYRSYLKRGIFLKVKPEYRLRVKNLLIIKITKMYFKMMIQDILDGHKVKLGTANIYLFIGNRSVNSKKFKGIEFLPYITIPRSTTLGKASYMYYFYLGEKYSLLFNRLIKQGKKYKLEND